MLKTIPWRQLGGSHELQLNRYELKTNRLQEEIKSCTALGLIQYSAAIFAFPTKPALQLDAPPRLGTRYMSNSLRYVLISPARNEEQYIDLTMQSMVAQTLRPAKWVIVSDGSTDRTDEIVRAYSEKHAWIELFRMPERTERHFAGKVLAFNAGYDRVKHLDFDVIGNLDADVSFEPEHFEFLIGKMQEFTDLGVAGSPFREGTFQYDYRFTNIENVWGGCQLFRRECYDAIGGYMPLKGGCIDHVAVVSARFHGWKTRTFPEKVCMHHRRMGTAQQGNLAARFRLGVKDHSVGNHPLWELSRTIYQMSRRPFVVGGLALGTGYAWAMVRRSNVPLSPDMVRFVRREQMQRLGRFLSGKRQSSANAALGSAAVAPANSDPVDAVNR